MTMCEIHNVPLREGICPVCELTADVAQEQFRKDKRSVGKMTDEDLSRYMRAINKTAILHRAELTKNPFDINALHNLNLLDNMAVSAINRYLSDNL